MKPITCSWLLTVSIGVLGALIEAPHTEGGVLVTLPMAAVFVAAAMAIVHWVTR